MWETRHAKLELDSSHFDAAIAEPARLALQLLAQPDVPGSLLAHRLHRWGLRFQLPQQCRGISKLVKEALVGEREKLYPSRAACQTNNTVRKKLCCTELARTRRASFFDIKSEEVGLI